jgi:peptide/nickel transport system substrate-binding protein
MPRIPRREALMLAAGALAAPQLRAQTVRTLNVGVVSDPVTLDPAFAASFFENQAIYNVHETLLIARPDGTIEPGLATIEQPDPLVWRLTLREGLTFHDGTPLDAAAAKASLDRFLDPAVGSLRRADFGPINSVVVTGPRTFELRYNAPFAPLPAVLTNRAGMIVSPTAVQALGQDFGARAVGAGPYRVASWTKNAELVLERFPGFWRNMDGAFDRIVIRPIPDETVRVANLRSGTLQLIDGVPPQAVPALGRESAIRVSQMPTLGFTGHSFNCTRPPFNDVRVRQAFSAAVDRNVINRVVYFGTGRAGVGPLSPSVTWAFDPSVTVPPADTARARALLREAGHTAAVPVVITVTNSPQQVRIAEILQAQANQAGFAVTIRQIDPTSLITVLRQRDFDICMSPWSGRFDPDGNTWVYFTRGGPNNFPGYESERVTNLLNEARQSTDRAARVRMYHEAQRQIIEDQPLLFLHHDAILQASVSRLTWTQYPDAVFRLHDARMA